MLHDRFTVSSDIPHRYDWFFHVQGKPIDETKGEPITLHGECEGYGYFSEARSLGNAKGKVLRFETTLGVFSVEIHSDAELILAKSPSNPADVLRETVLLRIEAPKAEFSVTYRLQPLT